MARTAVKPARESSSFRRAKIAPYLANPPRYHPLFARGQSPRARSTVALKRRVALDTNPAQVYVSHERLGDRVMRPALGAGVGVRRCLPVIDDDPFTIIALRGGSTKQARLVVRKLLLQPPIRRQKLVSVGPVHQTELHQLDYHLAIAYVSGRAGLPSISATQIARGGLIHRCSSARRPAGRSRSVFRCQSAAVIGSCRS